jgi:hypothetical protein
MANTGPGDNVMSLLPQDKNIANIILNYPAFAPLMKIPEIAQLVVDASVPGFAWNTTKFIAKIEGTKWWRQTSQPSRNWQVLNLVQPAEAASQAAQTAVQIHQMAAVEGIPLSPDQITFLTQDAISNGWNQAQMQQAVASNAARKNLTAGTIQKTATDLGGTASDYGVPLSPQTRFQWAQKIAEGTATADGFSAWAQDQAKAMYPTLAPHIDQGMTVRQLASPYMQIAAQTGVLDNPDAVNLSDPKWSQALQSRDAKTGEVKGPMSLSAWQQHLMTDPGYGYDHTTQARDAANSLVQQLGQEFGMSA